MKYRIVINEIPTYRTLCYSDVDEAINEFLLSDEIVRHRRAQVIRYHEDKFWDACSFNLYIYTHKAYLISTIRDRIKELRCLLECVNWQKEGF
jgi:hypothetical protein